ncbi:MAG: ribosome biogenesis GTP-binding protein YihA/YsxC [Bacteroidota bacterium]
MEIVYANYVGSYPSESQCPKDGKPEYAFIGRSNVGKSSLINMLCGRNELARVSKKPGKTQHINFYDIDNQWYIVDLPGYGYAKISKKKRHEWERMIEGYLLRRQKLACAFVLIDANVPPQDIDVEFINWMGKMQVPYVMVFTKTDRLKPGRAEANIETFRQELLKYWNDLPEYFVSSSREGTGRVELLEFIDSINQQIKAKV